MTGALLDSSPLLGKPSELRARFREDGCLYLAGFLKSETEQLLTVRRDMIRVLADTGLLEASRDPLVARPAAGSAYDGGPTLRKLLCLESVRAIWHAPRLIELATVLLDAASFPRPTVFPRVRWPGDAGLEAHCDHNGFHDGTDGPREFFGVWLPLGDYPRRDTGSLEYMVGAHTRTRALPRTRLSGSSVIVEPALFQGEWASADLSVGDILIHHSDLPHRGMPNRSVDQVRLSLDCHYQRLAEPLFGPYSKPWPLVPYDLSWEEVYKGWKSTTLQYFWRRPEIRVAAGPEDPYTLHAYKLGMEALERRDMLGLSTLLTLIKHYELSDAMRDNAERAIADIFFSPLRAARRRAG